MNMAKIKAISNQAREFVSTKDPLDMYVIGFDEDKFEAKFAELIVKECAKLAVELADAAETKMMPNFVIETWMKQHFGVKSNPTAAI